MITFGPYSFVLLIGALNGALLSALLLRVRTNQIANRLLTALILVVVLRLVPFIIGYAGFYDAFPWLSFAPFDMPLAMGPLLWLYIVRVTSGALPRRWWGHLVPAAADFLFHFIVFVSCTVPQKNWIAGHIVRWTSPATDIASLMMLAIYGGAALLRYRAYQDWLDSEFSSREEFRLGWLRVLLTAIALTGVLWLGFAATNLLVTPLDYFDVFPLYIWLAALAYFLGLVGWRASGLNYPIPPSSPSFAAPPSSSRPSSTPSGPNWRVLGDTYAAQVRENGWWRDPMLTLPELARRLATNTTYLSRALNQGLGQTFNEFINRLRVEAVAAELRAGSTRDLVQIGFDAGFNSKASFQRAFRLYMKVTPSEYRSQIRG